jgi:hypothetical protein
MNREATAERLALQAMLAPAQRQEDRIRIVAAFMQSYEALAREDSQERLATLTRTMADPVEDLPRVIEKVYQARQLMRNLPTDTEDATIALALLSQVLDLLGRKDLLV